MELTMAQFVEVRVLNPKVHPQQLSHFKMCVMKSASSVKTVHHADLNSFR